MTVGEVRGGLVPRGGRGGRGGDGVRLGVGLGLRGGRLGGRVGGAGALQEGERFLLEGDLLTVAGGGAVRGEGAHGSDSVVVMVVVVVFDRLGWLVLWKM